MSENNKRFFEEFELSSYSEWYDAAVAALKGAAFDKVMLTDTYEGIKLNPIYNKSDVEKINFLKQEFPGFFPFNRGTSASAYKGKTWEICQNINYPLSNDYNEALKYDLQSGQNSIKINLDKACLLHEDFEAADLNGKDLCAADLEDFNNAINEIDLNIIPIHIDAGLGAFPAFTALMSVLENNHQPNKLTGSLSFDFITEFAEEGVIPSNIERYVNEMFQIVKYSNKHTPEFKTIGIDAAKWHNAGANAVQEAAIALASAVFYVRLMINKGLTINEIAPNINFNFAIGTNFFMEIAKFRSVRIIWSIIVKEFGGNDESQKIFLNAVTSEKEQTKLDPYVNMLRNSSEVFSAVVGGCDAITVNNFDAEFGLPSEFSRRTARNIQNVIKYESHLDDSIDPAAGSYFIESLTNEMINKIWQEFLIIENNGGILEDLHTNRLQKVVEENYHKRLDNIAIRKDVVVGVNKYANINEKPVETVIKSDFEKLTNYLEKYEIKISKRDTTAIDNLLDKFEEDFKNNADSIIQSAVEAVKAGATLNELYNSIPSYETEVNQINNIQLNRISEIFENLREQAENYKKSSSQSLVLDFVCFGELRDWKARADFSNDFFSVGGFESRINNGFKTAAEAIEKIDFSIMKAVVVCSADDKYSEFLVEFANKVKDKNKNIFIILAGFPKDAAETYKNAGVDMFIHVKANIVESLKTLYEVTGILK